MVIVYLTLTPVDSPIFVQFLFTGGAVLSAGGGLTRKIIFGNPFLARVLSIAMAFETLTLILRRNPMRHTIKRTVTIVTTTTWTIRWSEDAADGTPPTRQTSANHLEQTNLALSEGQPASKTSAVMAEEEMIDAATLKNTAPADGDSANQTIHEFKPPITEGDMP